MTPSPNPRPPLSSMTSLAIDLGPLLVFFLVNFLTPGIAIVRLLAATVAFMVAIVIAMAFSWWRMRRISPMLWITGTLVLIFGGLTVYFHDDWFIKVKPTIIYGIFALILGYGLVTKKPFLETLLGTAYPGLSAKGWRQVTINWMLFFIVLAILNEIVRQNFSSDVWAAFKFPGVVIITFLFAMANLPMLMKHGLTVGENPAVPPES